MLPTSCPSRAGSLGQPGRPMEVEDLGLALERGFWGLRGFKTGMNADLTLLVALLPADQVQESHTVSLGSG